MSWRRPPRVPQSPLRGELTTVRPATETDADLLVSWHADPEVARYWDDETFTRADIVARLAEPDVDAYIVEAEHTPVGYLQAWFDTDRGGGLDMFLIPQARGRGLGPDAARALARHLRSGVVGRLTVDPYGSNEHAIHAWTKAGFRRVEERAADSEHREAWILMVFDPDAP